MGTDEMELATFTQVLHYITVPAFYFRFTIF